MASDQKNIEVFNRAANDPNLWRLRGTDLHTAAEVLRQRALEAMQRVDWSNLSHNQPEASDCLRYAGLLFQAAMLQGFAVECLLKCFWIVQGNTVAENGAYRIDAIKRENHDLIQIAGAVGFEISCDESTTLEKLSGFARSFGRYPIATKWQDQRLVKGHACPETGPRWDEGDHQITEAVIVRIKNSIDARLVPRGH